MSIDVPVSKVIRYLREKKSMSARAVSQAAGLSPSYVSKVESGSMEPSFKAFCRIAGVLGMTDGEVIFVVKMAMRESEES